jgi:DMSO/TMAO reductase YedYZ molybdopterin-dependent catalytic subunit
VTPRGTDWGIALLVAVLATTGVLGFDIAEAWVFAVHDIAAAALALLLVWKLRRVWPRLNPARWDHKTRLGAAAVTLVSVTLLSGWLWASFGGYLAGYSLLAWHELLGALLAVMVLTHALARAKPLRPRRDVVGRRQLLETGAITAGALVAWQVQRPFQRWLGWSGANRRFTGSYEADSFEGNIFPTTSWVADDPRRLDGGDYRLAVGGRRLSVAELDRGHVLVARLDCTGGFHSTQRWRGCRLGELVDRPAKFVRVISHTGYRWSFPLEEARHYLLATHVGDEPISHGHGAPLRLVAPGRRGFQWVKWVVRIELSDEPDSGALASTVWSSFTPEGRGKA